MAANDSLSLDNNEFLNGTLTPATSNSQSPSGPQLNSNEDYFNLSKNLLVDSLKYSSPDAYPVAHGENTSNANLWAIAHNGNPLPATTKGLSPGNPALYDNTMHMPKDMNEWSVNMEQDVSQNTLYGQGIGTEFTPLKVVNKFKNQKYGYLPDQDNEDLYANLQSWYDQPLKVVPRFAMGIVTKLGETAGFLLGLATTKLGNGYISNVSDNAVYKVFDNLDEWSKNQFLPVFSKASDRNLGFWGQMFTQNFWTNDAVDALSFLASAWIPGVALSELGLGAAMAGRLAKAAEGAGIIGGAAAEAEQASMMARWFANSGKAAKTLDAVHSWALATGSESFFESTQVRNDILNSPDYDKNGDPILNGKTGKLFTMDEKREMAAIAAKNTFLMNVAILSVSNALEGKYVSKLLGKTGLKAVEEGVIGGAEVLGKEAVIHAPEVFWKNALKTGAIATLSEGFYEENAQLAIQRYNTQYGLQGKLTGILDPTTWMGVAKQYGKQTIDALKGNDPEAAVSIGMGGVIGILGGSVVEHFEAKKENAFAEKMMTAFNESQNSWLKFGNVYKTEEVESKDKDGNTVKSTQYVLDNQGRPIYDNNKILAVATGLQLNSKMFDEAANEQFKFKQELLKARAWADFVVSHVNAGLENTLNAKLDKLQTADPADLAKLGFLKDETFPTELAKYRSIANDIIKQNKMINDTIIFRDNSMRSSKNEVDNNRRAYLVEIASRQVVNAHFANQVAGELGELKSKLITENQTDLTDGIVDQLNDLQHRISAQENMIQEMKDNGTDVTHPMKAYENVLARLKSNYRDLLKENTLSVKELTKNEDGTYRYKKGERNEDTINSQLKDKTDLIGQLKNHIDIDNEVFALFADRFKGKENYTKYFNAVAAEVAERSNIKQAEEKKKEEAKQAEEKFEKESTHQVVDNHDSTYSVVTPDGEIAYEATSKEEADKKAAELSEKLKDEKLEKTKAEEETKKKEEESKTPISPEDKKVELTKQELVDKVNKLVKELEALPAGGWEVKADGSFGTSEEYNKLYAEYEDALAKYNAILAAENNDSKAPTLDEFLKNRFDTLSEDPDFPKITFEEWKASGQANSSITDYNKKYKTAEALVQVQTNNLSPEEDEVNNLNLKNLSKANLNKAIDTIKKLYKKIAGNSELIAKLKSKIEEIQDDGLKTTIQKLFTDSFKSSEYIPISTTSVVINNPEHPLTGDKISMSSQEFKLGFTLTDKGLENYLKGLNPGELSGKIDVVATVEFIEKTNDKVSETNIPNRTLITYETPSEIKNKLQKGISVIAKCAKSDGFNIQIFSKDNTVPGYMYVSGGVDNYAIVHPDNTTVPITWSEEQREFIKANMLVDGRTMTDEQYDVIQQNYNKMDAFKQEVMPTLIEYFKIYPNENAASITSLFNKTFTLSKSGITATPGERFEDVLKKSSDRLFKVLVKDDNGNITEKSLPLIGQRSKNIWAFSFPLNEGETLVRLDEGEKVVTADNVSPVTSMNEYLEEVHGVSPKMNPAFPTAFVWISNDRTSENNYKPYSLNIDKGTEPIEPFKNFVGQLDGLKAAINKGLENKGTGFEYNGKTFTTLNEMLKYFNMKEFGFYAYGKGGENKWTANISYNPNAPSGATFLFELRPANTDLRNSLSNEEKKALNLYPNFNLLEKVGKGALDGDVMEAYNAFVMDVLAQYKEKYNKLIASGDERLKSFASQLDWHVLANYEENGNKEKIFSLKLVDKKNDIAPMPFLRYGKANYEAKGGALQLTFNDGVEESKINIPPPPAPPAPVAPVASSELERIKKGFNGINEITFSNPNIKSEGFEIDGNHWNVITSNFRAKILININGIIQPFYLTTGEGGKGLIPGWYPFFGIGNDDWQNKTDKSDMETYYERYWGAETANIIRSISEELNKFYGTDPTVFQNDGDPTATSRPLTSLHDKATDYINSKLSYTPSLNDANARKIFRNNVENVGKEIALAISESNTSVASSATRTDEEITSDDKPTFRIVDEDDDLFMLQDSNENYEKYTSESYNKEIEWLKKALTNSGIQVADLAGIVNNLLANKEVLGYYKNQAIYVNESLSAKGTIYHEAFHGLFRDLFTSDIRNFYLGKTKTKFGYITNAEVETFRNDRRFFNKTDEEIRDLIYEEKLADGFRKYKLEQKEPAEGWFKKFVKMFDKIINFFKGNADAIDQLYKNFDEGKYASRRISIKNISDEGAYALAYGRPKIAPDKTGQSEFQMMKKVPLSIELQNQLINKLAYQVSIQSDGTFTQKFNNAVETVKKDYNIDALIKSSSDPSQAAAIRNRYSEEFNEALFVLGDSVQYALDESLMDNAKAVNQKTEKGANKETLDAVRKEVKNKIETFGITSSIDIDNLEIPESEEDKIEKEKGGEFDLIQMNPLNGMSKEFRSLFSMIPYVYNDQVLGVKINKMADGAMLFNAMIKIAANTQTEQLLPSLQKAIDTLTEDNDPNLAPIKAFGEFISKQFGIADLSDPKSHPSKNIYLYKQFIDVFFVAELASYETVVKTDANGTTFKNHDATINKDIDNKKESIKFQFEQAIRRMRTDEEKAAFKENFIKLQEFIKNDLDRNLKNPDVVNARVKELNKLVNKTQALLNAVNINLPRQLIRQSFLGIYNIENELEFSAKSVKNRTDMEADQRLMKEGAYLQMNFWKALSNINENNFVNIFADTRDQNVSVGRDQLKTIEQFNTILKGAMKYAIKYDIKSAISVFQNAENNKVWRYSRYTPPILLAQMVKENGIGSITKLYPILEDWYNDNPLFDGSPENNLFLKNLEIATFGGFRQELNDDSRAGVVFGNIDTKALMISNLVHFMDRNTITVKNKSSKTGDSTTINTFNRSRTQEEATTTNFLVTGRYQKLTDLNGDGNKVFMDNIKAMLRQEYNRIQREWNRRDDNTIQRLKEYNNNIHPETKEKLESDNYYTSNGKLVELRAYQFKNFQNFFKEQKTDAETAALRLGINDQLRDDAKNNITFEESFKDKEMLFNQLFQEYMDVAFNTYLEALKKYGVIQEIDTKDGKQYKSKLIPTTITQDSRSETLDKFGYTDIIDLLKDQSYNIFMNKIMVNQIFDGDIATGIKSAIDYVKRNKSGVISGNSMKNGFFRTAIAENIQADVNESDLTEFSKDLGPNNTADNSKVDIADGQSWHTINHRIRLLDTWGRLNPQIREILNASKYRKLENDEIKTLDDNKVVLNSYKTATGGVFEYYKLSEHLIIRTDVSHLVVPEGMTEEQVYDLLDKLYSQIETIEDKIVENPFRDDVNELDSKVRDLYTEVHQYWAPMRSKAKLHYMLNSMEMSGIDQLMDPNASKKTTIVPVKLNADGYTDLAPSKSSTSGLFKFMQVETSGIHDHITLPTQARQLLTTYINKLTNDTVFGKKTISELCNEYSNTLGEISNSNIDALKKAISKFDESGQTDELNLKNMFIMMHNGLKQQGADSNTLKFFELKDGEPVHNANLPNIKKLFTFYYFAMFNDGVFSEKVKGRSDIIVSGYGYEVLYNKATGEIITSKMQKDNPELYNSDEYATRHLGISKEVIDGKNVYTVEVMIPEPLSDNQAEKDLYLEKMNKFFSTRIPTEDKRSMIVCKVVDYVDASYRNSIIVPQLVHILSGSDLDIDKIYSHVFDHYIDFNGVPHIYGDYSTYIDDNGKVISKKDAKFAEYITYMMGDSKLRDSINAEYDKLIEKPVFTKDFVKLKDQLGLSLTYSLDEIKQKRAEISETLDALVKQKKDLQIRQTTLFEQHIANNQRFGSKGKENFEDARALYVKAKADVEMKKEELAYIKEEYDKIENTFRLAATVNALKAIKMPTTAAELDKYDNNPVIPVLQNQSLQQKIDILSNEKVFKEFYIKEKSDTKQFAKIAKLIGASVEDVIKENSIYSIMGDIIANNLNSSNKDGIGVSAAFNKFLSFAEKNNISLEFSLFGTYESHAENVVDKSGKLKLSDDDIFTLYSDFLNTEGVRNIGGALGMFADAGKDPIPSVLNLNPATAGVSNLLISMSGNLQLGLLINKIPFIEQATEEVAVSKSAAQEKEEKEKNIQTVLKLNVINDGIKKLEEQNRLRELFEIDTKGNIIFGVYRPFYIETTEPNKEMVNMNPDSVSLRDVGFVLRYEDGNVVSEDVAKVVIANIYSEASNLTSDIIKVGRVLNLIKDQKPDFALLDQTLSDINYLLSGKSKFGISIANVLKKSAEYQPLIQAAEAMSKFSEDALIERTPLFKTMNRMLLSGFSDIYNKPNAKQNISDQISKFIIVSKAKIELKKNIEKYQGKTDEASIKALKFYEESLKYFTSDFWLDNNTLLDDLDYLYQTNPGNPFVEFLKVNTNKGINYLEATTRMKLDKDISENIINGYEALQKSKDERTNMLSKQMFYYLLVKDGLGYGSNTFISYLNPELKQFKEISDSLGSIQDLLKTQQQIITDSRKEIYKINANNKLDSKAKQAEIDKISKKVYTSYNNLLNNYFETTNRDWVDGILGKIFTNAANQKYIGKTFPIKFFNNDVIEATQYLIDNNVFPHLKGLDIGYEELDYVGSANKQLVIDFTNLKDNIVEFPGIRNILRKFNIAMDLENKFLESSFPILLASRDGKVFKLVTVDDTNVAEEITKKAVDAYSSETNIPGIKAIYKELLIEGTNKIHNFGFNPTDGHALYEHVQNFGKSEVDLDDIEKSRISSSISDNIPGFQTESNYGFEGLENDGGVYDAGSKGVDDPDVIAKYMAMHEADKNKNTSQGIVITPNKSMDEIDSSSGINVPASIKKIVKGQQVESIESITGVPTIAATEETKLTIEPGRYVKFDGDTYIVTKALPNGTIQIYNPLKEGADAKKAVATKNLEVINNKADIVKYKGSDYIVTGKNNIISLNTNKVMNWGDENGDRKAILSLVKTQKSGSELNQKSTVEIKNTDKIIFGHPTLGKTFLRTQGGNIIDFDTDYKEKINQAFNLAPGREARDAWRKTHEKEWNEKVRELWKEAKEESKKTNKILLASDMILLREFASDFDKVITMPTDLFLQRSLQRNDLDEEYNKRWKERLDIEISKIPSNKVINTTKYLSDLFFTKQATATQKQEITEKMADVINDSAKHHLPKEQFKTKQATQYIGQGSPKSSTDNYRMLYNQYGLANTGTYTSTDLVYVSSNGARGGRVNPVIDGILQGEYKNIDKAIAANARFIMDTKQHIDKTSKYNIGEVALAQYLASKGYTREDATGIWSRQNPTQANVASSNREFTSDTINNLGSNEVFVFGSNTEGRHGLGAAKYAKDKFGAVQGQPQGIQGKSYAIVTKNLTPGAVLNSVMFDKAGVRSVPLNFIGKGIQDMLLFAKANPNLKFYVTKLGTNNAGYSTTEIKSLFEKLKTLIPDNVILPEEFEVRPDIDVKSDAQVITRSEVDKIYQDKVELYKQLNKEVVAREQWMLDAKNLTELLKNAGKTKEEILEQLKCL